MVIKSAGPSRLAPRAAPLVPVTIAATVILALVIIPLHHGRPSNVQDVAFVPPAPLARHASFRTGHQLRPPLPMARLRDHVVFCPILMFHYVRIDSDPYDYLGQRLSVAPRMFDAQMRYIRVHGFHTVTVGQLADHIRYGTPLPSRPVALTFDDGYKDHYTTVLPILRRYGLRATFFIVSGFVGAPNYMSWSEVRALDRDGMEIGVHTIDHPDLTTLTPQRAWQEIRWSKTQIENHLGHPAEVFAYPSGAFDSSIVRQVDRAHYLAAVSTLPGTLHAQKSLDYLFRIRILSTDTPTSVGSYLTERFGDPFEATPSYP